MAPTDRFVAEINVRVRYAETDAMGLVHHASYIVYFEEGRTSYSRLRGYDYASFEQTGNFLTVSELSARYIRPSYFDQVLTVRCWLEEVRSRGLNFGYEIVNKNTQELIVTGTSKHICITKAGHATRLPEPWRSWGDS